VGQQHTLALDDAGVVYSWGSGFSGKLGHGDQRNHDTPTPIEALSGVIIGMVTL